MKKSTLTLVMALFSHSVLAVTTDFDYDGATTVVTAEGEIPLVCGIFGSEIGNDKGDVIIPLYEYGSNIPAEENLYILNVKSNSVSPVTYDVTYTSTTLIKASNSEAAVAGTDAYFTVDGTTKLEDSNSMIKVADGYSANIFAVTAQSFSYYAKNENAQLVATITVNCPDS